MTELLTTLKNAKTSAEGLRYTNDDSPYSLSSLMDKVIAGLESADIHFIETGRIKTVKKNLLTIDGRRNKRNAFESYKTEFIDEVQDAIDMLNRSLNRD